MKCETLTYSARATDFSVACAAGPNEALITPPNGALSAAPISIVLLKFLMWMQCHFRSVLGVVASKPKLAADPSHIFVIPNADGSKPARALRVNRSLARKLARLRRIRPASAFDGPAYRPEGTRPDLNETQYLEYMIRKHRWSRVRIHRLGLSWREVVKQSENAPCDMTFIRTLICSAIIAPD